jgi:HTH-type transcriptional regulator, sugar sensing transcriptional regulator
MKVINQSLVKRLEKGGFTDKEALVYVSLLELGGAFPSRVAEYAGLNRSTTYKILLNLSVRGIISEIEKKNKIFYQLEKPDKILKYSENRLRQAESSAEEIKQILPDIEGLLGSDGNRPKITYFDSAEGILSIYTDMVTNQKPYEMLAFSTASELIDFIPVKFFANYVKEKERLGIKTRGIAPDTEKDRQYNEVIFKNIYKEYWPEIRFVPKDKFPSSSEITVYGINKVSIINFAKNKLTGVIIEDISTHNMLKTIFELSWNSSDITK